LHATLRPYATAGLALAGAGLITATPAVAPPPALPDIQSQAVQLTSAWGDAFNTASENASTLMQNFALAPGVGLQQFLANQADYWQQIFDDPANFNAVNQQIQDNLVAVLTGYALQNPAPETLTAVTNHTLDGGVDFATGQIGHSIELGQLPNYLPADVDPDMVVPIANFLASPMSGLIIGALGPAISPWVALANSINDHDSFSDTAANMVGAYFNGATLNLDSLLPTINDAGFFPDGMQLEHLDFAFGGLFSTGDVAAGPYQVIGDNGDVVASVPAIGGSIFNSIGMEMSGAPVFGTIHLSSAAIGPIGAWEALSQTVGALLGSGWGTGPVAVTPPLVGVDLPTLPDATVDLDDGGAGAAAADSATGMWHDILTAFTG
jgi:hypothetical protein